MIGIGDASLCHASLAITAGWCPEGASFVRLPVPPTIEQQLSTAAIANSAQRARRSQGCRSGLIQPEGVEPDDVVDAEIIFWIVTLHVVVPDIEDIFPCDRY